MGRSFKVCTCCGHKLNVNALYDEELYKKSNILRLIECDACGKVADRYIEFEGVLVLIDLVLQRPEAYRHVLFNEVNYCKTILKMALLTVICDGYIRWSRIPSSGEFFEQEFQFYIKCLDIAMGLLVFLVVALMSSFWSRLKSLKVLILGLLMSYSFRSFNLAAYLWAPNYNDQDQYNHDISDNNGVFNFMWQFNYMIFFTSTVRSLQVVGNRSLLSCLMSAVAAHLTFNVTLLFEALILSPYCSLINKD